MDPRFSLKYLHSDVTEVRAMATGCKKKRWLEARLEQVTHRD